ncbi:MAG: hypothetical protein DHS20C13_17830 [Thermodesulfobacteriota bacterium]|nr:MAG: hypothetical protein DHS20C13_17830 [Thermodesulfobacteriota bacterium]
MTIALNAIKLLRISYLFAILFIISCAVGDDTPPATTTDLSSEEVSRLLNWTAPGDDGNKGRATIYFIRFYDNEEVAEILGVPNLDGVPFFEIEEAVRNNYDDAAQIPDFQRPDVAGTPQSFLTYRLDITGEMSFFYAIRTNDEVGNSSQPSNVAELTTPLQSVKYVSDEPGSCLGDSAGSGNFNGDREDDGTFINDYAIGDPCLGKVYIFFGQNDLTNNGATVIDVANADVTVIGNPEEMFGASLAGIPDFEDDPRTEELVIGAPGFDNDRGKVYMIFGNREFPSVIDLADSSVDRIEVVGENVGDSFGFSVADGDDVTNGAGLFMVGAPFFGSDTGRSYIFRGRGLKQNQEVPASDAAANFTGEGPGDLFGFDIENVGRIRRNSFNEMGVGAPGIGKAYIIKGKDSIDSIDDLPADTENVAILEGSADDSFGISLSGAGDIDEDGEERDDVIVGAPDSNMSTGSVFLYSGDSIDDAFSDGTLPPVETEFTGISPGDRFGESVTVMPELNFEQDKRRRDTAIVLILETINAGFAIGAPGTATGSVYVFFGQDNFPATVPASDAITELVGEGGEPNFGSLVQGLGDVNGDFFEDFAVGGTEFIRTVY